MVERRKSRERTPGGWGRGGWKRGSTLDEAVAILKFPRSLKYMLSLVLGTHYILDTAVCLSP